MLNILAGSVSKPGQESPGLPGLFPVLGKSLVISVPLIALLAWTAWRGYAVEKDLVREQLFTEAEYALAVQARSMESQIMAVVRDAVFLSGTTSMRNMLDRGAPEDRENLARQFLNAVARKGYDQVRYIDSQGRERIRAQLRLASPVVIPDEELQDKSDRYYVSAGLALERNEVYVTPQDLNVERGQIELPIKPTYRVCIPVFDSDDRKQGILVINVKTREMLEGLSAGANVDERRIMLLDDGGYWLKSSDPAQEWGFMYPERRELTFARRYPEAWNALHSSETGRVETDEGLYVSRLVQVASSGTEAGPGVWVFLGQLPGRTASAEMRLVALVPRRHFDSRMAGLTTGSISSLIGASSLVFLFAVALSLILERRKADKRQLQSLNARLEGVLDSATEVSIIATDPQGIITTFNRGAERLLGYEADELVGRKTPAVFHLASQVIVRGRELSAELGYHVEGFEVFVAKARDLGHEAREWTYVRKDGEPRIVNLTVTAIRDHGEAISGYLGVAQDITFEREAKAKLQFQNLLMNAFSEASPDAIVVVDVMDRAIYHNTRFLKMWGLPEGALDNRLCSEILAGVLPQVQDPEGFAGLMQELYADTRRTDFSEVRLKDGRTLERQSVGLHTEEGTYLGRAWFYRDVTERVRAAEALRAGEERLRLFIRHTPAAVAMFDTDMRYIVASSRWNLDYGLGEGDLTGMSHYEVFPEISQEWRDIHRRVLAGETMRRDEDPFPRADGSVDYVRWENVPWRRDDGSIGGIVMFTEVVTERRRAREALRKSQALLAAVLDNAVDGIVTIDTAGRVMSVNPAVESIFGWTRQEMEGGPVTRIMMEPYASKHDGFLRRYLETDVPHIIGKGGRELPGRRKDGSMVPVELAVSEVRVGETRLFTGILRDITERKQAQERLMTAKAELEARQMRLDEDLAAAGEIQKSLLPQQLPVLGGELEIDWLFEPSQRIGGDIFDMFPLGDGKLAVYILDVSGHGVPSALVTVSVSQALQPGAGIVTQDVRVGAVEVVAPARVMARLNREFPMERFDKFFTMVYLVLDHKSGSVEYCNAGHPPPLLVRADGSLARLEAGGMLVGMGDVASYAGDVVQLEPGDMLLLYTDGVTEYADEALEFYGEERLEQMARHVAGRHPDEALDMLWGSLMRFGRGAEPGDDISVICIRRCSR